MYGYSLFELIWYVGVASWALSGIIWLALSVGFVWCVWLDARGHT